MSQFCHIHTNIGMTFILWIVVGLHYDQLIAVSSVKPMTAHVFATGIDDPVWFHFNEFSTCFKL
jgi:hypothetical protein